MKLIELMVKGPVLCEDLKGTVEKVFPIKIPYTEENMRWAKANCVEGEPEIIIKEDPSEQPSQMDIIEAQVTYTAMMTNTLLEV